jgi:ABC-type Fe3+/spermidine/putrescine transport system ATPase subunit
MRSRRRTDMPVIEVDNLSKRYGDQVAVDDLSFTVEKGEIFGILGPRPCVEVGVAAELG